MENLTAGRMSWLTTLFQTQPVVLMCVVCVSDVVGANSKYLQVGSLMNGMHVTAECRLLLHNRVTLYRNMNRNISKLCNLHRKSMLLQTKGCNLRQSTLNFKTGFCSSMVNSCICYIKRICYNLLFFFFCKRCSAERNTLRENYPKTANYLQNYLSFNCYLVLALQQRISICMQHRQVSQSYQLYKD